MRERRGDLILLFSLSLLIRLVAVAAFHPMVTGDAKTYDQLAQLMASGGGFFDTYRTHGYLIFLAACYWLPGPDHLGAEIVQALVGAIGVIFVYLLALQLANRATAIAAGLLTACQLGLIVFTTELMTETLFVTLLALLLLLLVSGSQRSLPGSVLCGGIFGGTALVRPSLLYFIVPVILVAFILGRHRRVWIRTAAFVISVELVILPQQIYQYRQWGHVVVLDANSGLNFYIGNREEANGRYNLARDWKEREPFTGSNGYQRERIALREGVRFVAGHPRRFLALTLQKARQFWINPFFTSGLEAPGWLIVLDRVQWWVLIAFGAAGAFLTLRTASFWLLHLCVLYYSSVHALTITEYRFRFQLFPALVVLAAVGLMGVRARLGPRK